MISRRTLVAAKSQQRPLDIWLVAAIVLMSVEKKNWFFFAFFVVNAMSPMLVFAKTPVRARLTVSFS